PVRVAAAQRFTRLSTAFGSHNCALAADGSAWCWGMNSYGELGNGSQADSSRPVRVAGGLQFVSISAGRFHTCGVTREDVVWCWGGFGGLGTGHKSGSMVPVRIIE